MYRRTTLWFIPVALLLLSGHVGTNMVFFEGLAGPYQTRVIIRPPGVVPGLADISVRVDAEGVEEVTVQPIRWDAGTAGAPAPDVAVPVPGDATLYAAQLWLMTAGSHSVRVYVRGVDGEGTINVPVLSLATETLEMSGPMKALLLGLGGLLFFSAIFLIGAAVRESVLPPGESPAPRTLLRSRISMGVATVVLGVAVLGGSVWWDHVEAAYMDTLFEPMAVSTQVDLREGQRVLQLSITDPAWLGHEWTPLVPDHGKLMHMFIVEAEGLKAFGHIHPVPIDSSTFEVVFPPVPAGRYRIYADVTHESGFAQTLVDTVDVPPLDPIPAAEDHLAADPDDSWHVVDRYAQRPDEPSQQHHESPSITLADSTTMTWHIETVQVGEETTLRFSVQGQDGEQAALEPYMGMMSHAVVMRTDGSVFVHLHPSGSYSMAAKQLFESRESTGMDHSGHTMPGQMSPASPTEADVAMGQLAFPFVFPEPGAYRIWVQVKLQGQVLTGVFDTQVGAPV